MPYITTTATCGTDYTLYEKTDAGVVVPVKTISIKGGANCINKLYVTPNSVATKVSDEDYELLKNHPEFVRHVKNGFIKVTKIMKEENNKDLVKEDKSAQLTPAKYEKRGRKKPTVKLED
jgi:hypothetical protein